MNDNLSSSQFETYYHLTDQAKFKPNARRVPQDNTLTVYPRERPGLYVAENPERWINGHNYVRPFVAEVQVPKGTAESERWSGEKFIPGEKLDQARVKRVIPIDAYARETYGEHGWIEDTLGDRFDTHEPIKPARIASEAYPFRGYHYDGPDVREMKPEQIKEHKARAKEAAKLRDPNNRYWL